MFFDTIDSAISPFTILFGLVVQYVTIHKFSKGEIRWCEIFFIVIVERTSADLFVRHSLRLD